MKLGKGFGGEVGNPIARDDQARLTRSLLESDEKHGAALTNDDFVAVEMYFETPPWSPRWTTPRTKHQAELAKEAAEARIRQQVGAEPQPEGTPVQPAVPNATIAPAPQ